MFWRTRVFAGLAASVTCTAGPSLCEGFMKSRGAEGGVAPTVAHRRERSRFNAKLEVASHVLAHPRVCRAHCELDMHCWPSLREGFNKSWVGEVGLALNVRHCRERSFFSAKPEVSFLLLALCQEAGTGGQVWHHPCRSIFVLRIIAASTGSPNAHARPRLRSWARRRRSARA